MNLEKTLREAYELGIEVIIAKTPSDARLQGVHLIEPTTEQVYKAIDDAMAQHLDKVIIHSKMAAQYRQK